MGYPKDLDDHEPEALVKEILLRIGEDPKRDGLKDTPRRVVKSWAHLFSGYGKDPKSVLTEFENDGNYDEMVLQRNIEFYSTCEHHMLPFYGVAHIAYVPSNKIVGLSKLPRILEIYSRRLQNQERITIQVTDAINKHLEAKGAACIIESKHFCMLCRGVEKAMSDTVTSSLTGVFRTNPDTRSELMSMVFGRR